MKDLTNLGKSLTRNDMKNIHGGKSSAEQVCSPKFGYCQSDSDCCPGLKCLLFASKCEVIIE
jgi:ion channel inhibitory toxin